MEARTCKNVCNVSLLAVSETLLTVDATADAPAAVSAAANFCDSFQDARAKSAACSRSCNGSIILAYIAVICTKAHKEGNLQMRMLLEKNYEEMTVS